MNGYFPALREALIGNKYRRTHVKNGFSTLRVTEMEEETMICLFPSQPEGQKKIMTATIIKVWRMGVFIVTKRSFS